MAKKKQTEASASSPPTSVQSGGSELYTEARPDDKFNVDKMGFVEFGTSGLRRYSGYIYEDFLNDLTGKNAQKTYKEMVYNDPVVSSLIFAIKMMARKTDWYVEPASEDQKDLDAAEFLEGCMHDLTRPWKEVISETLSMIQYGHAPMEITYKLRQGQEVEEPYKNSQYDDSYVGWQSISLRSQETILKWEFFENGEIKGLWQLAPPFYKLTYIPWEKFLLFRTDYSKNNPEGKSILRAAFRPWMYKKHLEEIEAIGAERGVSGIPIAWVPSNIAAPDSADAAAVSAQSAYRDLVKNIRRDSQEGIVFPLMYNDKGDKMFDLTLLTTAGSETSNIGSMIERKSREILQVCLAEFIMLGSGKTGSFALSQTKVDLFLQAIGAYLDLIEEVFNTNAVTRLFAMNPQFKIEEMPKIKHADIKDMDLNNMGNYVSKLIGAGAIQPDDELSNYLRQAAGLPESLQELEVIGPREQAEMDAAQFQAGLDAKAQAQADKAGAVAKPKGKTEGKPDVKEEPKPVKGKGSKPVEKVISDNKRGNRYHDSQGRFSSSASESVDSFIDWDKIGSFLNPWQNTQVDTSGFKVIHKVTDAIGAGSFDVQTFAQTMDTTLVKYNVKSMGELVFGTLMPGVVGTIQYNIDEDDNGQKRITQKLTIDPSQREGMGRMWEIGQESMAAGKLPFNAGAYAKTPEQVIYAIAGHEVAHAKMVEYASSKPASELVNPTKPVLGTKAWEKTVVTAAQSGWKGPSTYAQVGTGEMFAECVVMLEYKPTTGNKDIDTFVKGVLGA